MVSPINAQAMLEPPFGLHWGDSPEKLIQWASRFALDVTISLPGDQPDLRVVKIQPRKGNLPETVASGVEGRFLAGKLFELTIHYQDPEASADQMETRFLAMRKQINQEQGTLLTNQQQESVEDQFITHTQSFHRETVKGLFLLLTYTEINDTLRNVKQSKFTIIYHNDNFKLEILSFLKQR
jgi:hypothetical protein